MDMVMMWYGIAYGFVVMLGIVIVVDMVRSYQTKT